MLANILAHLIIQGSLQTENHNTASIRYFEALLRRRDNTFILSARYVVERALEVFPWVLETGSVFVRLQIRVDEFDEAVEIFGRDLEHVSYNCEDWEKRDYGIVLLVEVVHVSVQNLNKELDRYCSIHACVCYS